MLINSLLQDRKLWLVGRQTYERKRERERERVREERERVRERREWAHWMGTMARRLDRLVNLSKRSIYLFNLSNWSIIYLVNVSEWSIYLSSQSIWPTNLSCNLTGQISIRST